MTNKEILENDDVKVVRCVNCKYSRDSQTKFERHTYVEGCVICANGEISDTEFVMFGDDFCSYGETKGDEE